MNGKSEMENIFDEQQRGTTKTLEDVQFYKNLILKNAERMFVG